MDPLELQIWITRAAVALLSLAALGGLGVLAGDLRTAGRRRSRLVSASQAATAAAAAAPGLLGSLSSTARRLGEQAGVAEPARLSVLRAKLMAAGYFNRDAVSIYLGARAAAMVAATIGALMLAPMALGRGGGSAAVAVATLLAAIAVFGPDKVLKAKQTRREREYTEGFPDLLDLLVASVEAGLSLDAGVTRVSDELEWRYPALTAHLRILILELRAGKSRREAWSAFAERLGIDDARALSTMLRQSEEMGTSLGETLAVFAGDMRSKRMLRAEEKAMALPAKLTLPLILFIFPVLLAVLMMPAAFRIVQLMGKGQGF